MFACSLHLHLSNSTLLYLASLSCKPVLNLTMNHNTNSYAKSLILVFHVCETFVVQLSSSDTHCLLCLPCTSQTIFTPTLLLLFVLCPYLLLSEVEYVVTSHSFFCMFACLTSFVSLARLPWTKLTSTWIFAFWVCSLSNFISTWSLIELASLPCSYQLHVLCFQLNCNANFGLYWILSVILQLHVYLCFLLFRICLSCCSCNFLLRLFCASLLHLFVFTCLMLLCLIPSILTMWLLFQLRLLYISNSCPLTFLTASSCNFKFCDCLYMCTFVSRPLTWTIPYLSSTFVLQL